MSLNTLQILVSSITYLLRLREEELEGIRMARPFSLLSAEGAGGLFPSIRRVWSTCIARLWSGRDHWTSSSVQKISGGAQLSLPGLTGEEVVPTPITRTVLHFSLMN